MISNNNKMLSDVIRREQRLAMKHQSLTVRAESIVKERSLPAYNERSWFELTIRRSPESCSGSVLPGNLWKANFICWWV